MVGYIIMKKVIASIGFFGIFAAQVISTSAAYFNNVPIVSCDVRISSGLQLGSEGKDVFVLQRMLIDSGFLNASPNGYFGYQTRAAVMEFQRNNGISTTGMVGPSTANAVNERLCDTDLVDNTMSYGTYDSYNGGYASGITYVNPVDPFVKVILPESTQPTVYLPTGNQGSVLQISQVPSAIPLTPSQSHVTGNNLVYNPYIGYINTVTQSSGSISVTSPVPNSIYREGDTVSLSWNTSDLTPSTFTILLENNNTNQSKVITTTNNTSFSFVLTKELLDAICFGSCGNGNQNSFRVVITTPVADIAGNVSTLRAPVTPIIIKRPPTQGIVKISPSKLPVDSGEMFKLYIITPADLSGDRTLPDTYSIRLHAVCPPSVTVKVGGVPCGQDFVIPFAPVSFQNEIPASITNTTWYKQDVTFELTLTDMSGNIIATSNTKVTANPAPFSW
jgi:peptidoglycan hydrolase-like protein with peptidoglycan-binding domain